MQNRVRRKVGRCFLGGGGRVGFESLGALSWGCRSVIWGSRGEIRWGHRASSVHGKLSKRIKDKTKQNQYIEGKYDKGHNLFLTLSTRRLPPNNLLPLHRLVQLVRLFGGGMSNSGRWTFFLCTWSIISALSQLSLRYGWHIARSPFGCKERRDVEQNASGLSSLEWWPCPCTARDKIKKNAWPSTVLHVIYYLFCLFFPLFSHAIGRENAQEFEFRRIWCFHAAEHTRWLAKETSTMIDNRTDLTSDMLRSGSTFRSKFQIQIWVLHVWLYTPPF